MHLATSSSLAAALFLALAPATAQGRGRGRAEEIQNRVGAFFADVKGPLPAGDQAGDLAQTDLVRAAAGRGQLAVLYLVDSSDEATVREQFERTVLGGDELGIMLRCFHCGRIDLRTEPLLAAKFQKQAPAFVVFDKTGKVADVVAMSGYKASPKSLEDALVAAARGVVKPSLTAFAKDYGGFVRDLEQALGKKQIAKERHAKAGADKAKKAEAEKDLTVAEKEEQHLLDRERELLGKLELPARSPDARRLGGRPGFGGNGGAGGRGDQGGSGRGGGG